MSVLEDEDGEGSVSSWLDEDGCETSEAGNSSTDDGRDCVSRASKAVAKVHSPFVGAVGGEGSALRLVKKLDMSVCFP